MLLLVALLSAAAISPAGAQHRRDPAVPYVSDGAGRLLLGLGASHAGGASFPLSGLEGDLTTLGAVTLSYGLGPGAVFVARGDLLRILSVTSRGPSAVPLDDDVADGTTHGAGEVRLGTLFRLLGGPEGLAAGLHVAVKLPTTSEMAGIGLNTTDVSGSVFGSWRGPGLRVDGELGVGILEAPAETFEQNDVLVYALEVGHRVGDTPLTLSASVQGRASTRDLVPLGTEDRGAARLQAELGLEGWRLDAGVSAGYAGTSPDWSMAAGLARELEL